jgi:hypothetical protein
MLEITICDTPQKRVLDDAAWVRMLNKRNDGILYIALSSYLLAPGISTRDEFFDVLGVVRIPVGDLRAPHGAAIRGMGLVCIVRHWASPCPSLYVWRCAPLKKTVYGTIRVTGGTPDDTPYDVLSRGSAPDVDASEPPDAEQDDAVAQEVLDAPSLALRVWHLPHIRQPIARYVGKVDSCLRLIAKYQDMLLGNTERAALRWDAATERIMQRIFLRFCCCNNAAIHAFKQLMCTNVEQDVVRVGLRRYLAAVCADEYVDSDKATLCDLLAAIDRNIDGIVADESVIRDDTADVRPVYCSMLKYAENKLTQRAVF